MCYIYMQVGGLSVCGFVASVIRCVPDGILLYPGVGVIMRELG